MIVILTIVVFICRWYEIHIRISDIIIRYMIFVFCLRYIDIIELYHLKRVLRQLGWVQIILPLPLSPEKVRRGSSGGRTMCHTHEVIVSEVGGGAM